MLFNHVFACGNNPSHKCIASHSLTQIHQQLMEQNPWGKRLKAFSWRIDVKTKARHIEQLNQPAAIMELQLSASNKDTSEVSLRMDYGNE